MKYFFLLFFSIIAISQNKPLQFEIDQITSSDSTSYKIYHLQFHISNTTDKLVSFIVNTDDPIPFGVGSGSHKMYYTLFENEKTVDRNDIFNKPLERKKTTTYYNTDVLEDVLKASNEQWTAWHKEKLRKDIMSHVIKVQRFEKKTFQTKIYWDKIRYRKNKETEYYIDEKTPYYLQLDMNLMLDELQKHLTPEEYQTLQQDPSIIKGWYTSNKMEINFHE